MKIAAYIVNGIILAIFIMIVIAAPASWPGAILYIGGAILNIVYINKSTYGGKSNG